MVAVASLNGDLVAIYNTFYMKHYIWNPATSISEAQPLEHIDKQDSLTISLDGRYIYALAARRNSCRIVDLHNTRLHARNIASDYTERRICVSADSSTVAVAVVSQVLAVTAYRVSDGFETFRITPRGCPSNFKSVTLSADGKLLLLCYGSEIKLWGRNGCIGIFSGWELSRLWFEAATISEDATYVIGVGYRGDSERGKSIVVWSVEGSTPAVVIDAHWPEYSPRNPLCSIHSVHINEALDVYLVSHDATFVLHHRVWSAAPSEVEISRTTRIPNERFTLNRDGWVARLDDGSGTLERLCWIPPSRRIGENVRFHGHVLPLISDSGEVSFLDLSAFVENAM